MQTEILPLGRLRLRPGAGYIVVSQFVDDEGFQHPCDERWIFVGFERPKMYPGYVLHIRQDGDQPQPFRLRWGSGGQTEVVQAFEDYVRSPRVTVESVLKALGSDDRELISKYVVHSSADSEDANLLFGELRRLAGNASVANGRSGIPINLRRLKSSCRVWHPAWMKRSACSRRGGTQMTVPSANVDLRPITNG